jgi:hypothetical protein
MSLLRGEAGRHVAVSSQWRCMVLTSSPRDDPHGGGDGEPWAGGVAHPRGAVRRGWHGGAVSSTVLSGAPLLAPPSTRDWHLVQSFEVTDGTGVEVWMVLQG